ncbi:fe(2+) transport protein 1-like [Vicia villosa]|uniref:fe(2+) transport protein 1-like n=1 Tax=Vicia villosa TaxID=3911 RepID=UPI00273C1E11|nr:fe(2+) transport protein 1-like [Vicia villosa]
MVRNNPKLIVTIILFLSLSLPLVSCEECSSKYEGGCHDKNEALKLKVIAIFCLLLSSMVGICIPIFTTSIPALNPDGDLFVIIKAFASGVILATGYMHVMPDSFADLTSPCLPQHPWHKFPFTTFIAMISAVFTLMVDSFSISYFKKKLPMSSSLNDSKTTKELELGHGHGHDHGHDLAVANGHDKNVNAEQLLRYRVVAQVLELGIVVHSVVIGLSMGASENPCTIKPLIAALCFHQIFEGMGLGGCILQADYGVGMKGIMVFFFSVTTPFGIILGIGLSKVYSDTSPTALIVEGILNAISAGLLNYMALVELLANDFMGAKLQSRIKLQLWSYVAVLLGAGGMSIMAIWA